MNEKTYSSTTKLPLSPLLALAMTGFICILTETLPAGLLPQIAVGLDVSKSLAGQTVTAYALGSLIAAIPLTIATQSWNRRAVLLTAIVGFLVSNSATALSENYYLTLTSRFFAGVSAGLAWSLIAGYARRMVPEHLKGKAMAVAMVGTPIALSLGVPLGTWLGSLLGWRVTFGLMSAFTIILIIWVLAKVPDYTGQTRDKQASFLNVLARPGVKAVLMVVMLWMLAHNILYTYISPFIALANLEREVDMVLFLFGVSALVSIFIVGHLVDKHLRTSVLVSLVLFAFVSLLLNFFAHYPIFIYLGVAIWGLTFGGAATLLQTALADNAGEGADVALSINVVVWNSAIAGGGLVGGYLLESWGVSSFPIVLLGLLIIAFLVAYSAREYGFRKGIRQST